MFEEKTCYLYFFNTNMNQMKRAIHIRCRQHFLYFETHIKSLKQLRIIICFGVLSISSAFTMYQHILSTRLPRRNLKKRRKQGTCTNNGSKLKLCTNRGRITFAWIWGLTGITFAQRKSITIVRKMYLSLFFTFAHRIKNLYYRKSGSTTHNLY